MIFFRSIVQGMLWPSLTLSIVILLVSGVYVTKLLSVFIGVELMTLLILIGLGLVGVVGGSAIAGHSDYELVPKPLQITGALFVGGSIAVMVHSAIQLMSVDTSSSVSVLLIATSILFFVEFILMRISQSDTISLVRIAGLFSVVSIVMLVMSGLDGVIQLYVWIFIGSGVISLLIGRACQTYLLSPWVNSFWNGWAILLVSALILLSAVVSGDVSIILEIAYLPIWLAIAVACISALALILKQLKHKLSISKGYMQYKLQVLTVLLLMFSYLLGVEISEKNVLAFVLIVLTYSLAEGRFIIKE